VGFDAETTEVPTVMRVDGRERHFLVRTSPVELGPHEVGRVRVFTDVTRFVTQQRDLGRQRREMDNIAEAVAHELRNDLNIAAGYAELLGDRLADDADPSVARSVDAVATAHRRMDDVIDDLTTLAELAQSTRHVEPHAFATVVDRARSRVEASGVEITVEGEGAIVAEVTRLTELLAKLFEHATDRDATTVAVALTEGGFVVRHDGRPLPSDAADSAFEYGTAVTEGIGLANARALARVHGWSLTLSTTPTDETEIVASGVETGPPPAGAESASAPTSAAERGRP
jgi:light-regulated signal transduction histidine kinase (bacteriophytochrome)